MAEYGYTDFQTGGIYLPFNSCNSHYGLKLYLWSESLKAIVKVVWDIK